ncbi:MAG: hypothetical protein KY475_22080, partial [Planctomycetes bacterium]|nr:hypothetical protein [Planctomycetota bacterium]
MATSFPNSNLCMVAQQIRDLIARGELAEATDEIRSLAFNAPPDLRDEAISLAGRRAQLDRDRHKGLLPEDSLRAERRRIEAAALELVSVLESRLAETDAPVIPPKASTEAISAVDVVD